MRGISGVLVTAITDHYQTRKYNNENKEKFIISIRVANSGGLIPTANAQNAFTVLFNKLRYEYDKTFPIVKIKKKYNNRKP